MIGPGRTGAPLLAGLSAGAVLVGSLVLAGPPGALPPALSAALGTPVAAPAPITPRIPAPPHRAPRRTVVPAPAVPPTPPSPPSLPPLTLPTPTPPAPLPEPTTATPDPTTTTPAPPVELDLALGVVDATNAERIDAGCDELDADARLAAAAQGHSEDMAEHAYLSHTGRDGSTFAERIRAEGHPSPGGENIAQGHESAAEVVRAWMDSPGHRRNILDCDFVTIGVGFDDRGNYWTQEFGR